VVGRNPGDKKGENELDRDRKRCHAMNLVGHKNILIGC
jgi:hypothetical protein